MQNVCRTCMGDSVTLVNIFSDVRDPALEQPERNLSYILSECTNRSVRRDDCQPQFICLNCVQAAQRAFRFKRQCDRSYHRFCELQNNDHLERDQDRDTKQAGQKDSRSDSSPTGHGGANKIRIRPCQTLDNTERTQYIYNVKGNRFVCSHCPNTYKTRSGLRRHLLTHSSNPDHKCPYCSKVFWRRDSYIRHLLTHGVRSPVSCNQCSTVCPDATHLEMHRQEHNGGAVEKKISVPDDLNLEADKIEKIKKENSLNNIAENPPLLKNVYKKVCDFCSDSFILEDDLKIHRILVHDINTTIPAVKSKTFVLNLEPKRLDLSLESSSADELSIVPSDDIPTSRQAESEFDQESISGHDTQSHSKFLKKKNKFCNSKAKRFQCPTCKRSYKSEKCMQQHQVTHFSKPKHHCPICLKDFWLRFRLTRHLRIHYKEGPYPCRQCSAIFIDNIQLKIHQREHEENKVGEKFLVPRDPENNIDKINNFRIP